MLLYIKKKEKSINKKNIKKTTTTTTILYTFGMVSTFDTISTFIEY